MEHARAREAHNRGALRAAVDASALSFEGGPQLDDGRVTKLWSLVFPAMPRCCSVPPAVCGAAGAALTPEHCSISRPKKSGAEPAVLALPSAQVFLPRLSHRDH